MARKREKPYFSRHESPSLSKRLRPMPSYSEPDVPLDEQSNKPTNQNSSMVLVTNLSHDCSVLKLKSRFEMYGSISRLRIDHGVGYITFRSKDSAEAAIAASLDPFLGITIETQKVEVSWPNDHFPGWREGVASLDKDSPTSKLLRPEVPLRKHGRGNKLSTTPRNPRITLDMPFKGREIIAYDDLL
ncbi:RNA recognition motif domain [Macleaya cordata]|uniref:RNA recognition motif domain n=1 Tax=Macleaya cordata TaxID=56857 RepID=A0A200PQ59_MACCD|nr:RNA recognition motif domain [Macleaya cordata]